MQDFLLSLCILINQYKIFISQCSLKHDLLIHDYWFIKFKWTIKLVIFLCSHKNSKYL